MLYLLILGWYFIDTQNNRITSMERSIRELKDQEFDPYADSYDNFHGG
jgi:hypothetical protein